MESPRSSRKKKGARTTSSARFNSVAATRTAQVGSSSTNAQSSAAASSLSIITTSSTILSHTTPVIDMAITFPRFVDLKPEIQVKIIAFAWAALRQWDRINEAHPCEFELGRMGLFCPSVPSFNDFRRSFKSRKLLPLAQKAIFYRSTLLIHVDLARENYSFLPVGYIPSILTTLSKVC